MDVQHDRQEQSFLLTASPLTATGLFLIPAGLSVATADTFISKISSRTPVLWVPQPQATFPSNAGTVRGISQWCRTAFYGLTFFENNIFSDTVIPHILRTDEKET
jgi:hypothetical protein